MIRTLRSALRPLREPGYAPLAASYTLNQVGDWVAAIALAILVFEETGDPLATTALFLAARVVPAFLAPALTARLDRLGRGRVLAVLYALEALLFVALAGLAAAFWLPGILVLAVLDGTLALAARGLSRGAIAVLLARSDQLQAGNALLNVGFAVSTALGPAIAGLLVATGGASAALLADAATFALAAVIMGTARGVPLPAEHEDEHEHWRVRLFAGIAYVRTTRLVRSLVLGEGLAMVLFTLVVPIEVVYLLDSLESDAAGYGAFAAAWGCGIVLGSLVFAAASKRSPVLLIAASTAAVGAAYVGLAAAPNLLVACAIAVGGGTGNGVQWVAVVTALQSATPAAFQARVTGLMESIAAAAPGLGFIIGGALTAAVSPRLAFGAAGAGLLGLVLVGVLATVRGRARGLT